MWYTPYKKGKDLNIQDEKKSKIENLEANKNDF